MDCDADRGEAPGSGFPTPPCGLIFIRMDGVLHRLRCPVLYLPAFHIEIYPDKENLPAGIQVAAAVVPLFDLIQSKILRLVEFEFKYEHEPLIRGNRVNSALVRPGFRLNADAQEHEDGKEQQMEIVFIFQVNIIRHFGEEYFHRFHESVDIPGRDRIREPIYRIFHLIRA